MMSLFMSFVPLYPVVDFVVLVVVVALPFLVVVVDVVVAIAACLYCEFHKRMRCLVACVINKSSILGEQSFSQCSQSARRQL